MPEIGTSNSWLDPRWILPAAKNALMYPVTHPAETTEFGLSMAPGSGEAMSAVDAWNASGRAGNALLSGNYGQAAGEYGNVLLGALGAIPGAGVIARGTKRGAAWMDRNLPAGVNRLLDSAMPSDPQNTLNAIPAWHGSPHDFEQFSMEHIGKGEGAQAYGHGLYFAENPAVAKDYANTLGSKQVFVGGKPVEQFGDPDMVRYANAEQFGDLDGIIRNYEMQRKGWESKLGHSDEAQRMLTHVDEELAKMRSVKEQGVTAGQGRLYHTELDVEPHDLLDWDKPLSQQSEKVRDFAQNVDSPIVRAWKKSGTFDSHTGAELYKTLGHRDQMAMSNQLREAGIPGIRYADQHSRFGDVVDADKTRNYVIFDDKLVKVLKKE